MKKSEMYKEAQRIVLLNSGLLTSDERLEILRELMTQEDIAEFAEEQEAKKNEAV